MIQTRTLEGRLISLEKYISDLARQIDDYEWDGKLDLADLLKPQLEEAKKRREQGEVWDPMF